MPGGLKKKELRTDLDLTPKQKMFVEILVQDWGSITQHEALQRAGYNCKDENSAKSTASQLLSRKTSPHVAKYFDKRFEQELKKYESDNLRRFKRLDRLSKKSEEKEAYVDKREVRVSGLEGMSREELESKLKELSEKIDGYNAKTVEAEVTDVSKES
jgi:phage terminase small subunit